MNEFRIESVGTKRFQGYKMPRASGVEEQLTGLWKICWGTESEPDPKPNWSPLGEFEFRERTASDPVFRVRNFGGRDGASGLDLLGRYTYRRDDSLVTIYIDSCEKAARRYEVELDSLVKVVLVHELAHLMTHRGLERDDLSSGFMEHTAQCATYAYLKTRDGEALKTFELLSPYQPSIYRTWEWLKELPEPKFKVDSRPDGVEEVVNAFFLKVRYTLRPVEIEKLIDVRDLDE